MDLIMCMAKSALLFMVYFSIRALSMSRPSYMEKERQKAIEKGHVLTAKLLRSSVGYSPTDAHSSDYGELGVYRYECNGRTYKRRVKSLDSPVEITLYYVRDPKRADTKENFCLRSVHWGAQYLIVVLVFVLLKKLG